MQMLKIIHQYFFRKELELNIYQLHDIAKDFTHILCKIIFDIWRRISLFPFFEFYTFLYIISLNLKKDDIKNFDHSYEKNRKEKHIYTYEYITFWKVKAIFFFNRRNLYNISLIFLVWKKRLSFIFDENSTLSLKNDYLTYELYKQGKIRRCLRLLI